MREIVREEMPIEKRSVRTREAMELFRRHGMYDKEQLFEYRLSSKVNIYKMKMNLKIIIMDIWFQMQDI